MCVSSLALPSTPFLLSGYHGSFIIQSLCKFKDFLGFCKSQNYLEKVVGVPEGLGLKESDLRGMSKRRVFFPSLEGTWGAEKCTQHLGCAPGAWWFAWRRSSLLGSEPQPSTAQPESMVAKCIKGAPELLDLNRPYECRDDGYIGDAPGGQTAYPMPLNHIRCCALGILSLGAENYWNRFLQIIMEACGQNFQFVICINYKPFKSYAHKIHNNSYLPGDIHFYDINFQIFCKMSFLLHLRLSLMMWFIISFKRFCRVLLMLFALCKCVYCLILILCISASYGGVLWFTLFCLFYFPVLKRRDIGSSMQRLTLTYINWNWIEQKKAKKLRSNALSVFLWLPRAYVL